MSDFQRTKRLLTIENLGLSYGKKKILRDINTKIDDIVRPEMQQGQVVVILGPSGVGKTQLFKCISGLIRPTVGKVLLNEVRTEVKPGQVGVVFQNYPLLMHRTVRDNLEIAAKGDGEKRRVVNEYLELFGLSDKADMYPAELSGGQRQRISIVQQLVCSDHFILMDEPFSGLDIISKQKMVDTILKVSTVDELNTLIVTTHDIETALDIADTIWIIGRQSDATGNHIEGATIVREIDLIAEGIAWNRNARQLPAFQRILKEIHDLFPHL